MFDSSLCDRAISKVPLSIPWWEFPWLKKLLPIILIILAVGLFFLGIRWFKQNKRLRRWFSNPKSLLLLFIVTAIFPLILIGSEKALAALLYRDSGANADAIVLLGRGGGEFFSDRVDLAVELWQAKRAPRVFVSGNTDAPSMVGQLKDKGIPPSMVDGENCSLTTAENAAFTAAILQPQGFQKIILVTDEPHMLRSMLVFRAFGLAVIPRTTPLPSYFNLRDSAFLTFREYVGAVGYAVRGLFLPQNSAVSLGPDLVNLVQQAEQYGKQRRLQ